MDENRIELKDDSINFMGLSEPKKINYLNFADVSKDQPCPETPLTVEIYLSQKVAE